MTKLYTLLMAGACALSVSAAPAITELSYPVAAKGERNIKLTEGKAESRKTIKAEHKAGEIPASIVGKKYVTLFNDWDIACNGNMVVAEGTDGGIVLKGFAGGYDVNATYDATTGEINIPVNVVIGTTSAGLDVTLYSLVAPGRFSRKDPIVGTVSGDVIDFNYGVYCETVNGGNVLMEDLVAKEGNGSLSVMLGSSTYTTPILATKDATDVIRVTGMSSILFGAYCPMDFVMNETSKTAVFPFGVVVDKEYRGTDGYRDWFCGGVDNGAVGDLRMDIATTENASVFSTDQAFWGYPNGGDGYTGYNFTNVKINIDFNVFTAKVDNSGSEIEVDRSEWDEIATATVIDGWITPVLKTGSEFDDPNNFPITAKIARNKKNANLLLVIDPYVIGSGFPLNDDNTHGYIMIDVTDPDFVLVTPQVFCGVNSAGDLIGCTNVEGYYTAKGVDKDFIKNNLNEGIEAWSSFKTDEDGNAVITIPTCRFTFLNDPDRLRNWTGRLEAMKGKITFKDPAGSAVAEIEADNSEAVYFNLQGVKVANPENGVFIRVQGGKSSKVIL